MAMNWPETVLVLDPECGHKLTTKPGANEQNTPHSAWTWAENEFRGLKAPRAQLDLMLRIWHYRYSCLKTFKAKYPNTYSDYDVYNATWVSCGYIDEQDEKAIELCDKRFGTPTGEVLDDPKIKSLKKV